MHDDFQRVQHPIFGTYSTRGAGLDVTVLDEPAVDGSGQPLPPEPLRFPEAVKAANELTGADLKKALKDRGLPAKGSADEQRAAVAAHDAGTADEPTPNSGDPAANPDQEV